MTSGSLDQQGADAPNLNALALTLEQSCIELMADYGVSATPQKWGIVAAPSVASLAAEVDFGGPALRGSVALCTTSGVILETARGASGVESAALRSLADWNSELVNQLLGRMKNKLRTQDVSVDVGVPRPLVSDKAHEPAYDIRQRFSCASGTFTVLLVVAFEPGLVLGECLVDEGLPSEGEMLLF